MPERKDNLTVTLRVTHRRVDKQPKGYEFPFSRELNTSEQCYERDTKATADWKPISLGWFAETDAEVGLLVIKNLEGGLAPRIPTPEEKLEALSHVLELRYSDSEYSFLVLPQEAVAIVPTAIRELRVRSRNGKPLNYSILIIPE